MGACTGLSALDRLGGHYLGIASADAAAIEVPTFGVPRGNHYLHSYIVGRALDLLPKSWRDDVNSVV